MSQKEFKKNKKITEVFATLYKEIIKKELCCACGACVAYCESQDFNVIKMENNIPQYKSNKTKRNCTLCGVCYSICPQTRKIEIKLDLSLGIEDKIGPISNISIAKTLINSIKKVGQDGGIVTTVLKYLFDKDKIDAAIVSTFKKDLRPIPLIIFNREDLLKSAGTRYSISPQLLPLKNLYKKSKDFQKDNNIQDIDKLRIAFVGTPCQVKAIKKMQYLEKLPTHIIKYIIGLFCFENFHYEKLYKLLEKETNVKLVDIKRTFIDEKFFIKTWDNQKFEVDLKSLDPAVRKHCLFCNDFTSKYSDISVGSTGAPEGYSTILTRNKKGEKLLKNLFLYNYIVHYPISHDEKKKEWKEKKEKILKRIISLKERKKVLDI